MPCHGWNQKMVPHQRKHRGSHSNDEVSDDGMELKLAEGLSVEDHGTEFYLVSEGDGHDLTLSLEAPVAERLARFILSRRGEAASGGKS